MEEADIGGLLARNEIAADTLVWRDGLSNWTEAQSTELGGFFSDAGSPPPPVSIVNHDEHIAGYFGFFTLAEIFNFLILGVSLLVALVLEHVSAALNRGIPLKL